MVKNISMRAGSRKIKGEWLKEEMERVGTNARKASIAIQCDAKKIYNHLNEETSLQAGVLASLAIEYPDIDMRYVLTGERQDKKGDCDQLRTLVKDFNQKATDLL